MSTTSELEPYAGGQLEQYGPGAVMTPGQAKALDEQVRLCTKAVLREGTDYGVIPGTGGGKTLWRPGAQKLLQWFRYGIDVQRVEIERDEVGRKHGITYRAVVTERLPDGSLNVKATCEGTADYDESKFYQTAEQVKAKLRDQEHKWAARDRRVPNADRWNSAKEYRADWNALMKRAQKRAIVGAVVDATAAGGIFADREEDDAPVQTDGAGSAWYEQALATALTFPDKAAGSVLYVEAAEAARDGLCTPKQANHVQNRIEQRVKLLDKAAPVDVEDLGRQAAGPDPTTSGASSSASAPDSGSPTENAAPSPSSPGGSASTPGDDRHRKLVGAVQGHFKRLGFGDEDKAERLWAAGKLAGVAGIKSLNDLDPDELSDVAGALSGCRDRNALETLLPAAGKTEDGTDG